jgi:hypothetical protein
LKTPGIAILSKKVKSQVARQMYAIGIATQNEKGK